MYEITLSDKAVQDLKQLKKSDPTAFKKAQLLLNEIQTNPYQGSGHPKPLKHEFAGYFSRRISRKHRLIYRIDEYIITVFIISAAGHYNDK